MACGRDLEDIAGGGDEVRRDEVVCWKAVLVHLAAYAAAEGGAEDTDAVAAAVDGGLLSLVGLG